MDQLDDKITLTAAAKRVPGRPHPSTLWRWCRRGIRGVRLRYLKVGRCIYTTAADLEQFFTAVTEADQRQYAAAHPTSSTSPLKTQHSIFH